MPEILLMRHAKSDHPGGMTDRDRPLSRRGHESAAAIGRRISAFDSAPDLVLTSPARRAADTAEGAADAGEWSCPIQIVDAFYGGGVSEVIEAVAGHWQGGRVLAVGHEPTWSATASALIGGGAVNMRTAAVVCVEFIDALGPGAGWLQWMLHPRLLEP